MPLKFPNKILNHQNKNIGISQYQILQALLNIDIVIKLRFNKNVDLPVQILVIRTLKILSYYHPQCIKSNILFKHYQQGFSGKKNYKEKYIEDKGISFLRFFQYILLKVDNFVSRFVRCVVMKYFF